MIASNCPICGHTPDVTSISLDRGNGHGYPGYFQYYVHCSNNECPLVRQVPMFTTDDIYQSKEQAYLLLCEKWNVETAKIEKLITNRKQLEFANDPEKGATWKTNLPCGKYRPFDPSLPAGSCGCAYTGPYNEKCEFYHKEYHMGGYISTCLNQDIFGWCECDKCPKNTRR